MDNPPDSPAEDRPVGGIRYSLERANSWDTLIEIYNRRFKANKARIEKKKWLFRAEKRNGEKEEACSSCADPGNRRPCQDENVIFQTSLEKAFRAYEINDPEERNKWEQDLVREFKRKLYHFSNDVPAASEVIEWLALMRHYFGPVRLLDCTYSFFVACYFAINELDHKKERAEVWAIDAHWLTNARGTNAADVERVRDILGQSEYDRLATKAGLLAKSGRIDKSCALSNQIVQLLMGADKQPRPRVYNVSPFRLNERLTNQNGTFLAQGDTSCCFLWNLAQTLDSGSLQDSRDHLVRTIVRFETIEMKKEALIELAQMRINHAVLFPDLRGFAESLIRRLAFHDRRVPN